MQVVTRLKFARMNSIRKRSRLVIRKYKKGRLEKFQIVPEHEPTAEFLPSLCLWLRFVSFTR
jgi:hypothetical protein